jgi:hypothetical protein
MKGVAWASVGAGMNERVSSLAVYNGELYAGGLQQQAEALPIISRNGME